MNDEAGTTSLQEEIEEVRNKLSEQPGEPLADGWRMDDVFVALLAAGFIVYFLLKGIAF